ncbi:hypothetical protein M569_07667 [Genlisea aurea]|uniref:Uncharacterized protein n=1 Tax=Genlisea aurea TaxID=192259 RepID=S8CK84_9LAMI|nr:hypothetical protein M569_07667 [Genlisea aurea]
MDDRPADKEGDGSAVVSEYPRNIVPLREEDPFLQGYYDSSALSLEAGGGGGGDGGGDMPFFSPYPNTSDRSELLQSILRRLPDDLENLPECSGMIPRPQQQQPLTLMTLPLNNSNQDWGGIENGSWGVPFDGSGGSSLLYTVISECNGESRPGGINNGVVSSAGMMIGSSNQAWSFFGDHEAVSGAGGGGGGGGWMGMEARFLSSWNK